MSCKYASYDAEEGWKCSVTGDKCMFFIPDSKRCAKEYGEGPDAHSEVGIIVDDVEEFTCQECEHYDSMNGVCRKTKEDRHFLDSICKDFKEFRF